MYITTYAADAQPWLDMTRLWQHCNNSSLMSKCKHLMDGTVMRKQSSPECWKMTSLESRINVTVKVVEKNVPQKKKSIEHLCQWVDEMIKTCHCTCSRTWDSVCYASLLSPCIILYLVYRKWQRVRENLGSGCILCKINQYPRKQAMSPWWHLKNNEFQSALWNLSSWRQF